MKKSQTQLVLDHLIDHGYITEIVARNYGVKRLASRMSELKEMAVKFTPDTRIDDAGSRYTYYWMTNDARDFERDQRDNLGKDWKGNELHKAA